ncbi:taurine dioxygenase [Streptomyces sp. SAI-135]|uniref:TauD/TfdA dioxygenase family protein n=1 Tax=unclassified Streptomyces TaxID=2593676 RepID=UPI002473C27B|nr:MULTISPECIES: TauD/TfdA family dioxygenase [unclassified Streptomyces]MDH6522740.1 taurine dioxygenase [Streptomyces sp. SAI-090]MDH6554361.1 taurine dioxygenase [Streptomyces sp. SAI-041]MDH6573624.1 taurine dioxygenase [Streptomyces sp. SAI-117]MDH6581640.1 taurine dioxygenase [Streptomyces sp. SAI-133]MDH6613645.1 taurine dioxygenase [Streptomyces sp. SAI-135]
MTSRTGQLETPAFARSARALRPTTVGRESRPDSTGGPYRHLALVPQSRLIGAEVRGIDLAEDLVPEVLAELKRALLEWKVLFFRGQKLTAREHAAVARHWGELEDHPFLPKAEIPEVVRLEHDATHPGTENIWHSDVSFSPNPPLGSMLRAVTVPGLGGDTLWADMYAAYEGLPAEVRGYIDGLTALHEIPTVPAEAGGEVAKNMRAARARLQPVEHPVVRTHPETGRKLLYVNAVFTTAIVGLTPSESQDLLDLLFRQAAHPEYQVRFHWEPGSVAFWDNRATQHYAVSDYFPDSRLMERVTVIGDRPY